MRLPAELRDEIFVRMPKLVDAHHFNQALRENRDPSVWQQLTRTHLPHVAALLAPRAQRTLASELAAQKNADLDYMSVAEGIWNELDIDAVTELAVAPVDTEESCALRADLLVEVCYQHSAFYLEHVATGLSVEQFEISQLHDYLLATLDPSDEDKGRAPKLELDLSGPIKKLPAILAGFDHVEDLVLQNLDQDTDLDVLAKMRGLKSITLHHQPGVRIRLPEALVQRNVIVRLTAP
jgi:uncharacterized protein YaeQ